MDDERGLLCVVLYKLRSFSKTRFLGPQRTPSAIGEVELGRTSR